MKGGITLFHGPGSNARGYLEADRATADDYYLEAGTALARFTVTDAAGEVIEARTLDADAYAAWVDWTDPLTGVSMGTPREAGGGKRGSPRFAEMVINTPKSLSIAAALHPEVSDALDAAQQDAADEIRMWLAQNSVTRVGPRGVQEVVSVESLQTVAVSHRTSRAGDPHRHIHFQIGTRVHAAGKWRALDTGALFKQQGAIRALGTGVIAAHPHLAEVLDQHGLTLDPATGEIVELAPFNAVMSKRAGQVVRNLTRLEAEWETAHPGENPGPVVQSRLLHKAWAHHRPGKKSSVLATEAGWRAELTDAGYDPVHITQAPRPGALGVDDLEVQEVASRALDRCTATASAWTPHTIREHVTRITTEHGVQATPQKLQGFVTLAAGLAVSDCFSVLPDDAARPDHVAHLTSVRVMEAETRLRDLLTTATPAQPVRHPDVAGLLSAQGLDAGQVQAAGAVASTDPLVIVEGAAGSGKTTMLRTAIDAATNEGRRTRVVAPTRKAAQVAGEELGIPADSVAALVHAHGFRWNPDGVWTRLTPGDTDPDTGRIYDGPPEAARLARGERVVVDEAGMLDQDTAIALLTVTAEAGATVALVGDRAQLPAVGRGGVLDIAAQLRGVTVDMTGLHRFTNPDTPGYAQLTLQLRDGDDPAAVFEALKAMGLVRLHDSDDALRDHIASETRSGDAVTVATNEDAKDLNARIQTVRLHRGEVDHARTVTGSDGLDIGAGDIIQTRKNDNTLGVANRQAFTVQHVTDDGTVFAVENGTDRRRQRTVRLPAEYVEQHAHLSYTATAYGVQGATVGTSHTVLDATISAAAVYVGLTRGRTHNILHVVADTPEQARDLFVQALARDRADRGLDTATRDAQDAARGLVADGPVAFVNAEKARLTDAIAYADQQAARWGRAAATLTSQWDAHEAEREQHHALVAAAETRAQQAREDAVAPLIAAAVEDGRRYLTAQQAAWDAATAQEHAGRLRKRGTARARDDAHRTRATIEARVRERWGSTPNSDDRLELWAATVAQKEADQFLAVTDAERQADEARAVAGQIARRQLSDRERRMDRVYGRNRQRPPGGAAGRHDRWYAHADALRENLAAIEGLPVEHAAQLIRQQHAEAEAQRTADERALAKRREKLATPERGPCRGSEPQHERGLGL